MDGVGCFIIGVFMGITVRFEHVYLKWNDGDTFFRGVTGSDHMWLSYIKGSSAMPSFPHVIYPSCENDGLLSSIAYPICI